MFAHRSIIWGILVSGGLVNGLHSIYIPAFRRRHFEEIGVRAGDFK